MDSSIDIEWLRPSLSGTITPNEATIHFQHLDIDHYEAPKRPGFIGPDNGIVPVIRMYGVTGNGQSVLCHVHGFHPYFFVHTCQKPDITKLLDFRRMLDKKVKTKSHLPSTEEMVLEVDHVTRSCPNKVSGDDDQQHFLKIVVATPRAIEPVRRVFAKGGLDSMGVYFEGASHRDGRHIYEANIDFVIRFLSDLNIPGTCWIELPIKKYSIRCVDCSSNCQLECDINYTDLIAHPPKGHWANMAPFRMLSFDIETTVGSGIPQPEKQQVIQISNIIIKHGYQKPFVTTIFTVRSCAPIVGAVVKSYNSESEMLMAWSKFIVAVDPDIMTGYNINNFDTRYLIRRAEVLGLTQFPYLGRIVGVPSKKLPKGSLPPYSINGRIQFDLMPVIMRNHGAGLARFKLNEVARHYLGMTKDDIHYTEITGLFNGTADDRRKLAMYCIKDSELVLELIHKLACIDNHLNMARESGLLVHHILAPIRQAGALKTSAKLLRSARELHQLVPDVQS